jgi:NinB protein
MSEKPETRSLQQNKLMWSMLEDIAHQVVWYGQKLNKKEWKDVITAGLKRQKIVPGIDGGFVVVGSSTSAMTIKEMNEVIEMCEFFGGREGVKFRAPESYYAEAA